ncbi:hypothetical protein H0H92_015687 [Tricholoma furcatifolium]|nr:hypothetical protein H0H92_015687 [Tricholoma furcatifolium]
MVSSHCVAGPSSLRLLSQSIPAYSYFKAPTRRNGGRPFSVSSVRADHYKTLGVPWTATKAQIKLSKKHHPDVSKDVKSKEVFSRVTEAYTVLSDDRERRLYDRSLLSRSGPNHPPHNRAHQPSTAPSYGYRPRPSSTATHAWEYSRRHPNASSPYTRPGHASRRPDEAFRSTHPGAQAQARHPGQGGHYEPPRPPEGQGRAGHVGASQVFGEKMSEEMRRDLELQRISGVWRALQIIGVLAVSIGVMGSLTQISIIYNFELGGAVQHRSAVPEAVDDPFAMPQAAAGPSRVAMPLRAINISQVIIPDSVWAPAQYPVPLPLAGPSHIAAMPLIGYTTDAGNPAGPRVYTCVGTGAGYQYVTRLPAVDPNDWQVIDRVR